MVALLKHLKATECVIVWYIHGNNVGENVLKGFANRKGLVSTVLVQLSKPVNSIGSLLCCTIEYKQFLILGCFSFLGNGIQAKVANNAMGLENN